MNKLIATLALFLALTFGANKINAAAENTTETNPQLYISEKLGIDPHNNTSHTILKNFFESLPLNRILQTLNEMAKLNSNPSFFIAIKNYLEKNKVDNFVKRFGTKEEQNKAQKKLNEAKGKVEEAWKQIKMEQEKNDPEKLAEMKDKIEAYHKHLVEIVKERKKPSKDSEDKAVLAANILIDGLIQGIITVLEIVNPPAPW